MKIRTKTGQMFDVERNAITQILLDAGLATVVDTTPKPAPGITTWMFGVSGAIPRREIRLHAHCSNPHCITKFTLFYGAKAAETATFSHCGRQDKCPPDIAEAYAKAYRQWQDNGR